MRGRLLTHLILTPILSTTSLSTRYNPCSIMLTNCHDGSSPTTLLSTAALSFDDDATTKRSSIAESSSIDTLSPIESSTSRPSSSFSSWPLSIAVAATTTIVVTGSLVVLATNSFGTAPLALPQINAHVVKSWLGSVTIASLASRFATTPAGEGFVGLATDGSVSQFLVETVIPTGWDTLRKMILMEVWRRVWIVVWRGGGTVWDLVSMKVPSLRSLSSWWSDYRGGVFPGSGGVRKVTDFVDVALCRGGRKYVEKFVERGVVRLARWVFETRERLVWAY